jgi:hypothetical protein
MVGANTVTISAAAIGDGPFFANFDPVASNTTVTAFKIVGQNITITLSNKVSSSGAANTLIAAGFLPEGSTYKTGLYVAAGDLNGDGTTQIVTSRSTGVPNVQVFDAGNLLFGDYTPSAAFNPYTSKFTSGAQIAVGDVDGDGDDNIVTAPGTGQTVQVKIFNYASVLNDKANNIAVTPDRSFLGFASTFKGGVSLSVGDFDGATFNGSPIDDIALGAGSGGTSQVRIYDDFGDLLNQFKAYTTGNVNSALRTAAITNPTSGQAELFIAQANDGRTHLVEGYSFTDVSGTPFDTLSDLMVDSYLEMDPAMIDGVFLG